MGLVFVLPTYSVIVFWPSSSPWRFAINPHQGPGVEVALHNQPAHYYCQLGILSNLTWPWPPTSLPGSNPPWWLQGQYCRVLWRSARLQLLHKHLPLCPPAVEVLAQPHNRKKWLIQNQSCNLNIRREICWWKKHHGLMLVMDHPV